MAPMRLVRDDAATVGGGPTDLPSPASLSPLPKPRNGAANLIVSVGEQMAALQSEIDALSFEVNHLRRRDETLRFYMQRIDEELRLAARIQQDFLPKSLPQVGPVHFHSLFRPAGYVSGDLYDVMRLDEHHVGFFICDAVGHGMPAALLTMFVKKALVTKEIFAGGYRLLDPGETLARLNQSIIDQELSQATYATALYGIIDTRTLEMRFARGGHPSPAVLRAGSNQIEFVEAQGPLLGIFPDEPFTVASTVLAPGDRVLIYSDGIEVGFCGDDVGDTHKWREHVEARAHLPAEEFLREIADGLDAQSGSLQPKDDVTMLVIEVK
ncbi:MAG: PP2C family protein-serine/threonine phosphatase [Phycisphaerae bacterium]